MHFLHLAAWAVGSVVVGFASVYSMNILAKGSYNTYSPWQKRRTRFD